MPQGKWTFRPVKHSVRDNVAPNSNYTKSVRNEFVVFPGSQTRIQNDFQINDKLFLMLGKHGLVNSNNYLFLKILLVICKFNYRGVFKHASGLSINYVCVSMCVFKTSYVKKKKKTVIYGLS